MKSKSILVSALIMIGFSTLAHASGSSGRGGGDGIACAQGAKGNVEMLDYYEASLTTNLKIDLGPDTGKYMDRVNYVLDRLEKMDPVAATRYRQRANDFISEAKFISDAQMKTIQDDNEPVNPPLGCVKKQFAIQLFNVKPNEVRYLVNQDLWNQANSETRAGLILHEAIYRDAADIFGQTNSDEARYFNAQISSAQFANLRPEDYVAIVHAAGFDFPFDDSSKDWLFSVSGELLFPNTYFKNVNFDVTYLKITRQAADPVQGTPASFHVEGGTDGGNSPWKLTSGETFPVGIYKCTLSEPAQPDDGCMVGNYNGNGITSKVLFETTLFGNKVRVDSMVGNFLVRADGTLASGILEDSVSVATPAGNIYLPSGSYVTFAANGVPIYYSTPDRASLDTTILQSPVSLDTQMGIYLYPNGLVASGTLTFTGNSTVDNVWVYEWVIPIQGHSFRLNSVSQVYFWDNGMIQEVAASPKESVTIHLTNGQSQALNDSGQLYLLKFDRQGNVISAVVGSR
jgi:hypothetical protein